MKPEEFKELVTETQKEYILFCYKRKCSDGHCTIYNFLKKYDCLYINCTIVFTAYKLLNDFNINLIKEINKSIVHYSNEHSCTYHGCDFKRYQLENPFLFSYESQKEREYVIECSMLYAVAYLNDCLNIIIKDEDNTLGERE